MVDIKLSNTGRIVNSNNSVDIYLSETIPIYNFTSIDNFLESSTISGIFLATTFPPSGIDVLNRFSGVVLEYSTLTSGINIINRVQLDTNLRRSTSISGSKFGGKF